MNSAQKLISFRSVLSQRPKFAPKLVRQAGGGEGHGPGIPFPPGKRQYEQLRNWMPTLAIFGATAGATLCYATDWQVVCAYIPFYNTKFKTEE